MSKKVFVGGLSWNTNDAALREAFEPFGAVADAKVVADRETGRSRGFGFVTFSGDDGVQKAIAGMNGRQLDGRTLKVDAAEDKPRTGGGGGGSRSGGNRW